jgi:dienelactone hydrolase
MKTFWKWLSIIVITLGLLVGAGIGYLATAGSYHATSAAQTVAHRAETTPDYFLFKPTAVKQRASVIFYPGAFVASDAYSIWAARVAEAGYAVYLLKTPLSFSLLSQNAADKVLDNTTGKVVIGGHSLGGVVASGYVGQHQTNDRVRGLFLLASYPQAKDNLAQTKLPVLSVTASKDKVLNWQTYRQAKAFLPAATSYVTLKGGNHGGFGSYGHQKGDGRATIANAKQQTLIAKALIAWLATIR